MTTGRPPSAEWKPHAYAWEKEYKTGRGRWRGTTNFNLDLPPKSRVLEVGCGNGKTLSSFFKNGFELYGIDIAPSAIQLARDRCREFQARAELAVADATQLPFPDQFFDAVFLFHLVGHLSEAERELAVAQAFRVLKKGGTCYFRGFESADLRNGKGIEVEPGTFRKGTNVWTHYFTEKEVRQLFQTAGFSIKKLELDQWTVHFRDKPYLRSEVVGEFVRP